MMTVEQYSNQEFSELYQQRFVEMMFKYHEELYYINREYISFILTVKSISSENLFI